MAVVTEVGVIESWLDALLRADTGAGGVATLATGGIYRRGAIIGNLLAPTVFYGPNGGSNVNAIGATRRVMTNILYAVFAAQGPNITYALDPIAARLNTLLQGASGVVTGGMVMACTQEAPLPLDSSAPGGFFRGIGGLYRIYAQTT